MIKYRATSSTHFKAWSTWREYHVLKLIEQDDNLCKIINDMFDDKIQNEEIAEVLMGLFNDSHLCCYDDNDMDDVIGKLITLLRDSIDWDMIVQEYWARTRG